MPQITGEITEHFALVMNLHFLLCLDAHGANSMHKLCTMYKQSFKHSK